MKLINTKLLQKKEDIDQKRLQFKTYIKYSGVDDEEEKKFSLVFKHFILI